MMAIIQVLMDAHRFVKLKQDSLVVVDHLPQRINVQKYVEMARIWELMLAMTVI